MYGEKIEEEEEEENINPQKTLKEYENKLLKPLPAVSVQSSFWGGVFLLKWSHTHTHTEETKNNKETEKHRRKFAVTERGYPRTRTPASALSL